MIIIDGFVMMVLLGIGFLPTIGMIYELLR